MQKRLDVGMVLTAILAVMIVVGPFFMNMEHRSEIRAHSDGDMAHFSFDTDYVTHYSAVTLDNGEMDPTNRYIACYDENHIWLSSNNHIQNALDHLVASMEKSGLELDIMDSGTVSDLMKSEYNSGRTTTCVIFLTGSLPHELYNGTEDCCIIDWLSIGGRIIWGNGPIGKYMSSEDGLDEITGYSELLFDAEDAINTRECFDTSVYEGGLSDLIKTYYTDCSYGIRIDVSDDLLYLDNQVDGYAAVAIVKYHGGSGQITVFGGNVNHLATSYVTQVILSGITYDTVVLDSETGVSKSASGALEIIDGRTTLIVTIGLLEDYITKTFRF